MARDIPVLFLVVVLGGRDNKQMKGSRVPIRGRMTSERAKRGGRKGSVGFGGDYRQC
jgi:hypothetical protein